MQLPISLEQLLAVGIFLKLLDTARVVYNFFFREGKKLRKYGEWALVTGATDGIGKAYAFELARQGLKVLLVARSKEKLIDVEKELKAKYPALEFDHLVVDFSNVSEADRAALKAKCEQLDLGVLINNVGLSYPFTKYFHELKDEEVDAIIRVNIDSCTLLTRAALGEEGADGKGMLARRRGAIVNTSSVGGRVTSPLLAEYSGAKAYVDKFSRGLHAELDSKGVHVQVQTPLYVATKMAKIRNTSITVPSPEAYARCAARQIGYSNSISPHWAHALQLWLASFVPEFVLAKLIMMQHLDIRRRGIKKEKQKEEESKKGQ